MFLFQQANIRDHRDLARVESIGGTVLQRRVNTAVAIANESHPGNLPECYGPPRLAASVSGYVRMKAGRMR